MRGENEREELLAEVAELKMRLNRINDIACYVSEENTEARYAGLLEIGKLARGEPSAFTRPAPNSEAAPSA